MGILNSLPIVNNNMTSESPPTTTSEASEDVKPEEKDDGEKKFEEVLVEIELFIVNIVKRILIGTAAFIVFFAFLYQTLS